LGRCACRDGAIGIKIKINIKMGPSVTRRASVENRWDDGAALVIPAQAGTQCLSLLTQDDDASRWVPA
jgi:hypothetical protein